MSLFKEEHQRTLEEISDLLPTEGYPLFDTGQRTMGHFIVDDRIWAGGERQTLYAFTEHHKPISIQDIVALGYDESRLGCFFTAEKEEDEAPVYCAYRCGGQISCMRAPHNRRLYYMTNSRDGSPLWLIDSPSNAELRRYIKKENAFYLYKSRFSNDIDNPGD